jgi:PP-loop superfamily ATP-utilizing enzyme
MPWDSHGGPHAVIDGVEAEDLWVRRPGYDSRKCALLRRCVAALISTWCAMA